jgi:hypothetical protein
VIYLNVKESFCLLRKINVKNYFLGVSQEEQLLAIRYTFLLLPDETREVLETILRFLFDVSLRSGNSQVG